MSQTAARRDLYDVAFEAYRAGQPAQAELILDQLLDAAPTHTRALLLKGVVHRKQDPACAIALVEQAAYLDPFDAQNWYNLGVFESERQNLAGALDAYERAVAFDPLHVDALGNGCELLRRFDRFGEALVWADRQIALGKENWAAHLNRAICLMHVRDFKGARQAFDRAAALEKDRPIIQWETFSLNLFERRFREAWACFEQRFACGHLNGVFHYPFPQAPWRGEPLEGKHILIHNEQGLGDQIMFACALPDVFAKAGRVSLVVSPELVGLFSASFPQARVYPAMNGRFAGDHPAPPWLSQLGPVDYQLPIGGLMHRLRNSVEDFTWQGPYIRPSDAMRERWRATVAREMPREKGLRVGLCWASNPALFRHDSSRRAVKKSMALDVMSPLMDAPGVQFVSVLNWKIDPVPPAMQGKLLDVSADLRSMEDTAALIEALDLVIAVDTSVAHLAGAMGRPVWLVLHDFADCRWELQGAQSYWYPSMQMFRQPAPGDWDSVIRDVRQALPQFVEAAR
jgi:Flp pilus assembly protein TadD